MARLRVRRAEESARHLIDLRPAQPREFAEPQQEFRDFLARKPVADEQALAGGGHQSGG